RLIEYIGSAKSAAACTACTSFLEFNDIDIDGNAAGHSSNAKDKSLLSRMLFWRSSARPSALDTAAPQAAPLAPAQALVAQQTASNP
ncbi:MAG: hypothetical protein ACPIOQ_18460, partial [Promethearchaeia archaeon]